jgi:hypothetical protein
MAFSNYMSYLKSKGKVTANYELEGIRKRAVMAYFEVISQHLSGDSEEKHEQAVSFW